MRKRTAADAELTSRSVERPAWSPAQFFGAAGGIVLVVFGAIALARTGTNFTTIPATHAMAAGMHFTSLSAIVQLGAGVLLLAGSVVPTAAKATLGIFGVLLVVWGIVIVADTARLFTMWGYTRGSGTVYIIIGAVLVLAAAFSPIFSSNRRQVSRESQASADSTASPRPA